MSGTAIPPLSVRITAQDTTGPTLDKFGKKLQSVEGGAEKFGKRMQRLGDTGGVNRLSEGFKTLAGTTGDSFRAVSQLAPAITSLTGATTIAGMTALVTRFGQLGQQAYLVGQRLSIPTDRLTALRGAMRLAGGSAEDMDAGLTSLTTTMNDAMFGRNVNALQAFQNLHVQLSKDGVHARTAAEALGDVADAIQKVDATKGRHAAVQYAKVLGIDNLLPLLLKGRAGIQSLSAEAARMGSVITPAMAERAQAFQRSWTDLSLAIEGVENDLGDKWGQAIKPWIDSTAKLISVNHDAAGSFIAVGTAIVGLTTNALVGAAIRKWTGLAYPKVPIGRSLLWGTVASLYGDTGPGSPGQMNPDGTWGPNHERVYTGHTQTIGEWYRGWAPTWLGGNPAPNTALPRGIRNNNPLNLSYLPGQGADHSDGRFGVYKSMTDGVAAAERQLLTYQGRGLDTIRQIVSTWAPPGENDTEGYIKEVSRRTGFEPDTHLNLRDADQAQRLISAMGYVENGREVDTRAIQAGVDQALHGQVDVNVHVSGAPPGTRVTATGSGAVRVPPPRVETAMPTH